MVRTTSLKDALERGIALHQAGELDRAENHFRQLISQHPTHPDVLNLLGVVFLKRKNRRDAADMFRQAIAVRPDIHEFHSNLAAALHGLRQWKQGEQAARAAIALKPDIGRAWELLGVALANQGRRSEAMDCYRKAIERDPNDADAHTSLGVCYFDDGNYEQAMIEQRAAIALRPDFATAHLNLALILLLLEQEEEGWEEYEWRSQCEGLPKHNFRQPLWDGSPLNGERILLYTEQGLGDAIQFVRFVPEVAARGGQVLLVCQDELKPLLTTIAGAHEVCGRKDPLPKFDLYAPLLSLPRIFKLRTATMQANVPYLSAEPARVRQWRDRLESDGAGFRVGLVWAGSPGHRRDQSRSCALKDYAPLATVEHVRLYSLQKGAAAEQVKSSGHGLGIIDHTAHLHHMADTAAFIANLDLVITVDTSVCHVAGALGKPVWTLIASVPHWGWGLQGQTTAWYPTMRLIRQTARGDWSSVMEQVKQALTSAALIS